MNLEIVNIIRNREIIHYASGNTVISSKHNKIYVADGDAEEEIVLPKTPIGHMFGGLRLVRRALRLDKVNVAPYKNSDNGLATIYGGKAYYYSFEKKKLEQTLDLNDCRNVLHQSIARLNDGMMIFGEYGANKGREESKNIYKSSDGGRSWDLAYSFAPGEVKHIHGCYWDKFSERVFVFTGDRSNECKVISADIDFNDIQYIGEGGQVWRACNAFFEKDAIYWIMDSQYEDSYSVKLERGSREPEKLQKFPGPVWYIKRLTDGYYLAATAQEKGPGVHDGYSHLFASRDAQTWEEIHKFKHDGYPKGLFKFGVIGFADGSQTSDKFYIFGEALKGFDGMAAECRIVN